MLPGDGTLIDPPLPSAFAWRMRQNVSPLTDYERGGAQLNLAGDSLDIQTWEFGYTDPDIWVQDEAGTRTTLLSTTGVTELAGAFDQNMNPFVAFTDATGAHYWWFDSTAGGQVLSDLPAGSVNPRCCIDDRRDSQLASSDIILAYMRGGSLYYRQQRDRFAVEYLLASAVAGTLQSVGLHDKFRLQFKVRPSDY